MNRNDSDESDFETLKSLSKGITWPDVFSFIGLALVVSAVIILIVSCIGCTAGQIETFNSLVRITNDLALKSEVLEETLKKQNSRINSIPRDKKLSLEDWLYIFGIITGTTAGVVKTHGVLRNKSFDRRAKRALRHMSIDLDSLPKKPSRQQRRLDPRMGD